MKTLNEFLIEDKSQISLKDYVLINEMGLDRSSYINKIKSLIPSLICHLIYIIHTIRFNSDNINMMNSIAHWKDEIFGYCRTIANIDVSNNKSFFKKNALLQAFRDYKIEFVNPSDEFFKFKVECEKDNDHKIKVSVQQWDVIVEILSTEIQILIEMIANNEIDILSTHIDSFENE